MKNCAPMSSYGSESPRHGSVHSIIRNELIAGAVDAYRQISARRHAQLARPGDVDLRTDIHNRLRGIIGRHAGDCVLLFRFARDAALCGDRVLMTEHEIRAGTTTPTQVIRKLIVETPL